MHSPPSDRISARHPNLWYPFSPISDGPPLPKVVSGDGAILRLEDGRSLVDCISSWWVNLHGHAHPYIADAIATQARTLEHVVFAGFTHEPAEALAERLVGLLPGGLTRVFYSDDGSTAVEVALKMAHQHWRNRGETRRTFVAFEGAYHGDTFGAMSVGARSAFSGAFDELLFPVERLPFPDTWIGDETCDEREDAAVALLEARLADKDRARDADHTDVAAVIVEPLVQGAGGMRMCRPSFLRRIREITRAYDVLLVFDEVMTGFGRTGARFACERSGVEPDLICLAKGLTGGFLPLAATVASTEVYESFAGGDPRRTLWHGHSYTANPLGCAAALASLDLLKENAEAFRGMETQHLAFLETLADLPVERPRVTGTIVAFDLVVGGPGGYFDPVAAALKERAPDKGLLLRPLGNTVYLMPPYCVTEGELSRVYDGVRELVREVTGRS
jgi:adenosylmethionine-8-amino-7-oxononanoate aminotransferase